MLVSQTKELRKQIDFCIKTTEKHLRENQDAPASKTVVRELCLVRTKLQEAKMWAGKILEVMGRTLPEEYRDEYKKEK